MQHLQRACQGHVGYSKPVWVESEPGDGEGGPGIGEGEPGKPDDEVKDNKDKDDKDKDDKVSLDLSFWYFFIPKDIQNSSHHHISTY